MKSLHIELYLQTTFIAVTFSIIYENGMLGSQDYGH